jgi:chromosome segregation ATPase
MQNGRQRAEQQVRQLTLENDARAERIKALIADYETMKNELMGSNTEKDEYIDNLNKEIAVLNEQLSKQKESLKANTFTYGFEKERLSESLQERDKTIRSLESKINELENDLSQQSSAVSERNVRISGLNDQVEALEAEVERKEKQRAELQQQMEQQLQNLKKDIESMNEQLKTKDETITRLQNNVNLLKKELGGN